MYFKNILFSFFFIFLLSELKAECKTNYENTYRLSPHLFLIDTNNYTSFSFSVSYSKYWTLKKISNDTFNEELIAKDNKKFPIKILFENVSKSSLTDLFSDLLKGRFMVHESRIGSICTHGLDKNSKYALINLPSIIIEIFSYLELLVLFILTILVIILWKLKIKKT